MPRKLKLYIAGVVALSAIALIATTLAFPIDHKLAIGSGFQAFGDGAGLAGVVFWIGVTLIASATPVRMPRGAMFAVSLSTIMAATILGGPAAGAWVGVIGTAPMRSPRVCMTAISGP